MDNQEAKFILSAYRPGGQDAKDGHFADALAQAGHDPELKEWLRKEREFDAAMTRKLSEVPVPEGLREAILAGGKAEKVVPFSGRFPWVGAVMAAAAALLVLAVSAQLIPASLPGTGSGPMTFAEFEGGVSKMFDGPFGLQKKGPEHKQLREWLIKHGGQKAFQMPEAVQELASIGCRTIEVKGHSVSLICFWVDKEKHEEVHLFVVERGAIRNPPEGTVISSKGNWVMAGWSDERHTYILASVGDEDYIRKFL